MLNNYLIVALRNLLKQKTFTLINIFGLAVGVACFLILGLYVRHEFSYDRHHPNAERTYRIVREYADQTGNRLASSYSHGALNPLLRAEIPGVETSSRVMVRYSKIVADRAVEREQTFCLADPEILDIFDLPLIRGNRETALNRPWSILVTESAALRHFGKADPVGKSVRDEGKFPGEYIITGILRDLPETSFLQFDFLTSTPPEPRDFGQRIRRHWSDLPRSLADGGSVHNFVLLEENAHPKDVEERLAALLPRLWDRDVENRMRHHLQPILRAHLYARQDYGITPSRFLSTNGDIRRLYVAGALGGFILLLAGVNFVNLSTARATTRAREVGMRKVVGAHRRQIVGQFLGESTLLSALAHLFALSLVTITLTQLSSWIGVPLTISEADPWLVLSLAGSILIVGLLAGGCPAVLISRFRPITALKGGFAPGTGGSSLRRSLVLFQFAISVLLIAGTYVVFSQWQFMTGRDPGYDKENVVILPHPSADRSVARERFLAHPGILHTCVTNNMPIRAANSTVYPEGKPDWRMHRFDLDTDVLNVYGIELIAGRDFVEDRGDGQSAFILNESAVKALGWDDPIGKQFRWGSRSGHVIGVVRDFHFESLQQEIKPLYMSRIGNAVHLSLRVESKKLPETMAFIETTWKELSPDRTFEYQFLDKALEGLYRSERKATQVFFAASALAILIALLGLVGLASFSTEQRTKEIGIRKVLGASWPGLISLFTRDFIKLVALANLIVLPVSIYLTRTWLNEFAYRIELGPWPFLLSAVLSLLMAAFTVFLATLRPATKDPVIALRAD
jgi:putative ABC transport system permease protein